MLFRHTCRLLKPTGALSRLQTKRFKMVDGLPDDRDAPSQQTQVNMLSIEDDGCLYIHEYSNTGFTLRNGMQIFGPTVFFPRSFFSWKIRTTSDISDKSLSLFSMLHPKLDLLIIGKGDASDEVSPNVIAHLRKNKLNFEILTSEQAMSTFNFLNKEHRWIAAAILPPQFIFTQTQQDIQEYFAEKKREHNMLIGDDDDVEQIETETKPEVNMFGFPILKSPLEDSFTDVIEANSKATRRKELKAAEDAKKEAEEKRLERERRLDEDPWAEDDDISDSSKSTDKSIDKKDK